MNTYKNDNEMMADMLHAILTVYANAAESPEWIRMRLAPIIQQAIHNHSVSWIERCDELPEYA